MYINYGIVPFKIEYNKNKLMDMGLDVPEFKLNHKFLTVFKILNFYSNSSTQTKLKFKESSDSAA
jgi:hypothetical protein